MGGWKPLKKVYGMNQFQLTPRQIADYHRDGYLIVKSFLSGEEIEKLYGIATEDEVLHNHAFDLNDQSGRKTKLTLWYNPGDDTFGLLTRSKRMVDSAGGLTGGGFTCLPFPLETDAKGTAGGWRLGMAPGLRILVQE